MNLKNGLSKFIQQKPTINRIIKLFLQVDKTKARTTKFVRMQLQKQAGEDAKLADRQHEHQLIFAFEKSISGCCE